MAKNQIKSLQVNHLFLAGGCTLPDVILKDFIFAFSWSLSAEVPRFVRTLGFVPQSTGSRFFLLSRKATKNMVSNFLTHRPLLDFSSMLNSHRKWRNGRGLKIGKCEDCRAVRASCIPLASHTDSTEKLDPLTFLLQLTRLIRHARLAVIKFRLEL
ncbi:hypothetical protein BO82DRAFT_109532 [Aspergillus uvarum CBS 121591]|uniref:Uncharacterized protein n=1 Tax=Aspergillus uvarum CBS 121591 TaxID=1448315 RepID=A0A319DLR4_9EURO|nr:hypothetical protein BO82DRAFT_109532 [Aspergillus uvarum CBS 121591]PYH80372.1 hypothetical protein BO82DRAFT_109532 [Aspergillus uvarum CBS 121591]